MKNGVLEFIPEKKYMKRALELAYLAGEQGEIPVGAVVVLDGRIVGEGYNTRETRGDPLGHAEITAIRNAAATLGDWRLTGAILYVTLEPCPMCAGAAVNARIARIVYGADDENAGGCGGAADLLNLKYCHKPKLFRNFMEEECRAVLGQFFRKIRE